MFTEVTRPISELTIETQLFGLSKNVEETAKLAETLGFDAVWSPEMDFDSFLSLPIVAEHTEMVEFGPRIATAFTRSPMVLAYMGWDLQRYSNGRFVLGLGTQVAAHNKNRFSVDFEWESPGPRLREVVQAIRHIGGVFQGNEEDLDFQGKFYQFSLMTDFFRPDPIDDPDIPIHIAGVNEYNLQLSGEIADGLVMHGFNTPKYTEEVIKPLVENGADRGDRSIDDVDISASPFVITGRNDEEMQDQRREVRRQLAFYGSTPAYHDVFEIHEWTEIGPKLNELSKGDQWGQMTDLITDEMIDTFAIQAPIDELADEIYDMYGGVADRVMVYFESNEYWSTIIDDFQKI